MSLLIAKRYAVSLFELADESYQIKKVMDDMDRIHQCFIDCEDFRVFVCNPTISTEKKVGILKALFASHVQEVTFEFLKLLAQKKRLECLDLIAQEFKRLFQEKEGVVSATVIASETFSVSQVKDIQARLKKHLDKEVELAVTVDDSMLGGFKIQMEDQVFDYTLDHQLKSFKEKVLKG